MISKWDTLSKTAAANYVEGWTSLPTEGFDLLRNSWKNRTVEDCPLAYVSLREQLVAAYDEVNASVACSNGSEHTRLYQREYLYALRVFEILNSEGLSVRAASDDGVWRFLSMVVVPDIVYDRWKKPNDPRSINAKRFYLGTRRIWLKVLWWYVYLCWQGSTEATAKLISTNNADEISQLVERAGTGGYRVELFREIMRYYDTNLTPEQRISEKNLLSRVLQLNIARSQIIEPDLIPGGVSVYVKQLFEYFNY